MPVRELAKLLLCSSTGTSPLPPVCPLYYQTPQPGSRSNGSSLPIEPAIVDAVTTTGPAVLIDAFGVALGLDVLILSQVPANPWRTGHEGYR